MWRYMKTMVFSVFLPVLVVGQRPIFPDYPSPRMVMVGPTGSGKSSLGNALLGCDPRLDECMFTVCPDMESCTKDTKIGTGKWLGTGVNFTIVDTPGFGDTDNQDEDHMEKMMDILANNLEHSDTFLLVLKGTTDMFSEGLQTMLDRMTLMFGKRWWDFVVIGVNFWAYDQDSIDGRECFPDFPEYCKDEAWFARNINNMTQERFAVQRNFTFVFTDSFSQTAGPPGFNTDDPLQQVHWKNETEILWNITTSREDMFPFMTINDFMEENTRPKAEIKWLNDVITNNISQLNVRLDDLNITHTFHIAENTKHITENADSIKVIVTNVEVNTNNIAENRQCITENADSIEVTATNVEVNTNDIRTTAANIEVNKNKIEENSLDVQLLNKTINHLKSAPVGAIVAWTGGSIMGLPDGWMRCDGTLISEGDLSGKRTPKLNGVNGHFLRGGPTDMEFEGIYQDDQIKNHLLHVHDEGHFHYYDKATNSDNYKSHEPHIHANERNFNSISTSRDYTGINVTYRDGGDETRPRSFCVEWIIRIY